MRGDTPRPRPRADTSRLLVPGKMIAFLPILCRVLGNERRALIVQQLFYLTELADPDEVFSVEGEHYVFKPYKDWVRDQFNWIDVTTLRKAFDDLVASGVVDESPVKGPRKMPGFAVNHVKLTQLLRANDEQRRPGPEHRSVREIRGVRELPASTMSELPAIEDAKPLDARALPASDARALPASDAGDLPASSARITRSERAHHPLDARALPEPSLREIENVEEEREIKTTAAAHFAIERSAPESAAAADLRREESPPDQASKLRAAVAASADPPDPRVAMLLDSKLGFRPADAAELIATHNPDPGRLAWLIRKALKRLAKDPSCSARGLVVDGLRFGWGPPAPEASRPPAAIAADRQARETSRLYAESQRQRASIDDDDQGVAAYLGRLPPGRYEALAAKVLPDQPEAIRRLVDAKGLHCRLMQHAVCDWLRANPYYLRALTSSPATAETAGV